MSTFATLNPQLQPFVVVQQGGVYQVDVQASAGAGFLCSVAVEGDAAKAEMVSPVGREHNPQDTTSWRIGGPITQQLRVEGLAPGKATLTVRHARPWMGAMDPLAEEVRITVDVS